MDPDDLIEIGRHLAAESVAGDRGRPRQGLVAPGSERGILCLVPCHGAELRGHGGWGYACKS